MTLAFTQLRKAQVDPKPSLLPQQLPGYKIKAVRGVTAMSEACLCSPGVYGAGVPQTPAFLFNQSQDRIGLWLIAENEK